MFLIGFEDVSGFDTHGIQDTSITPESVLFMGFVDNMTNIEHPQTYPIKGFILLGA